MMNPQALCLLPGFVLASLVPQMGGTPSLTPVLIGPDRAYLRSEVKFQCTAPGSPPPITYQLLKDVDNLVAVGDDPRGDHPLTFFLKVSATSEGSYHCRATAGGRTGVSRALHLLVVTPVSGTVVTSDPAPPVLYEGARLLLRCDVTRGSHLSYTWFFNRQEVTSSPTLRPIGNTLVVERVAEEHAGNYSCMAGSRVGDIRRFSSSGEIQVKVKTYLSEPKISFTIFKEGSSFRGNITCQSLRGTPPVTFHLLLDNLEVDSVLATDTLAAWFLVAMVPGQERGVACCRAESEELLVTSEALTLYVAPVGGSSVQLEVEYLYRADSKMAAARLCCLLDHGTFPSFSWSLNGSLLTSDSQSHALADGGRTLLLTQVTAEESGYYRCRARDSYDDSSKWVESEAELVMVPAVTMTTLEGIAIAFCCFLLLALVVGVACVMRMLNVHQQGAGVPAVTPRLSLLPISFNPDALPLSDITSRSEVMQTGTSCVDSLVQNPEPL